MVSRYNAVLSLHHMSAPQLCLGSIYRPSGPPHWIVSNAAGFWQPRRLWLRQLLRFAASSAISGNRLPHLVMTRNGCRRMRLAQILDLFAEDNRLNVYAGELEVRPPGAPTTGTSRRECWLNWTWSVRAASGAARGAGDERGQRISKEFVPVSFAIPGVCGNGFATARRSSASRGTSRPVLARNDPTQYLRQTTPAALAYRRGLLPQKRPSQSGHSLRCSSNLASVTRFIRRTWPGP